jgi:flagellar protein FlaI
MTKNRKRFSIKPHMSEHSKTGGEAIPESPSQLLVPMRDDELLESYALSDGYLEASVEIKKKGGEHVKTYDLSAPRLEEGTNVFLDEVKAQLLKKITISAQEVLNIKMADGLKAKFLQMGKNMVREGMPQLSEKSLNSISQQLVQDMLGLGKIDYLLHDDFIEEITVNGGGLPVWVYHKKYGWLKTNIFIETDSQAWNYASSIARGVGRQINTQNPLLDAYLSTGDRVNATLFPISYFGNTITIRKFARKPWTITDYIKANTLNSEVAALLWLALQYEMNIIVSGGTGAGKTSLLNVLSMFIPPNHRVVSIEQTREINLPSYMQWVPLVVRQASSEGSGEVGMLDLMVNSLRMRPDRMIVGEIRRADEAQVLFEAMHTGHSVYATLHAETVSETVRRLVNPPIGIAPVLMESLHMVVAMYRDRRNGLRRVYEVGEIIPTDREGVNENIIYRWRPSGDTLAEAEKSVRLMESLKDYTNMGDREIADDLRGKQAVLDWMVKHEVNSVAAAGDIISSYYVDPEAVVKAAGKK